MYPSSSSHNHRPIGAANINRYGSAPVSLLSSIVDSVIADDESLLNMGSETNRLISGGGRYFPGSGDSEFSCRKVNDDSKHSAPAFPNERLQRSSSSSNYAFNQCQNQNQHQHQNPNHSHNQLGGGGGGGAGMGGVSSSSPLIRHSSSPAGFFNQLMVDNAGFSVTRGIGSYRSQAGTTSHGIANARLKSQLSFTRQDSLSQISEVSENIADGSSSDDGTRSVGPSYVSGSFPIASWEDTNTIMFSSPPNKRAKILNEDIVAALSGVDSHSQFGLQRTALERASVDSHQFGLQIQSDSVPCKIRAKRGCATHPRSIAERERRTRISEKLRKLQELVPNMDKQTSTADMLELAVQHIKGLQSEVQKLNKDLDHCTCGCKQAT